MGLPVVSTPIAAMVRLKASHAEVVTLAADPAPVATAIGVALGSRTAGATARRIPVARENSCTPRIDRMVALVEDRLAARP